VVLVVFFAEILKLGDFNCNIFLIVKSDGNVLNIVRFFRFDLEIVRKIRYL